MMLPTFDYTVPTVQPGDLLQLGRHYLLSGDSTNEQDVMRFLPYQQVGHLVRAIITDPPYGEIQAKWDKVAFGWIRHVRLLYEPQATMISFCSLPFGFTLVQEMTKEGWEFRFDLVWEKKNAGFKVSPKLPVVAHEHLFAFAERGVSASQLTFNGLEAGNVLPVWGDKFRGKSPSYGVYAIGVASSREGQTDGSRWIRSLLPGRKKQELPEAQRTIHPSQKPLELVEKLVILLTNPGQVVYDPFLGSGTTLLACEKTGRACIAIEQSPEYCQIAIERWMKLTGEKPARIGHTSTKGAQ